MATSTANGPSIIDEARKFLGDEYVYGASGPSTFDCSGLVQYVLSQLGIKAVPRTSEAQYAWATKIQGSQLQPGDLVFSQWAGDNASPGHVAFYAGGGQVLEASETGQPVHLVPFDSAYKAHVVGYGRPPGAGDGSQGNGGGLLSLVLPSGVTSMFSDATTLAQSAMWLINPENWARIIAGTVGVFLALFGLGFLIAAGA